MSTACPINHDEDATPLVLRWLAVGLLLCPLAILNFQLVVEWQQGRCPTGAAIVGLWFLFPPQLALVLLAFPRGDFSVATNLSRGPNPGIRSWRVEFRGLSFGFAFAGAFLALAFIGAAIVLCSGRIWKYQEAIGMTFAWVAVATMVAFLTRSRPRLKVDEIQREVVWHSCNWLDRRLTLPFSAITDICVQPKDTKNYHIVIHWRTSGGTTRSTELPGSASRSRLHGVVVRLRAAVGLPLEVTGTAARRSPDRGYSFHPAIESRLASAQEGVEASEQPAPWYDQERWFGRVLLVLAVLFILPWRSSVDTFAIASLVGGGFVWMGWSGTARSNRRMGRFERVGAWAFAALVAIVVIGLALGYISPPES